MARKSTTDHQTEGDVLIDRLSATTLPASLKKVTADFKKSHTTLASASDAARSARAVRDDALVAVGTADDALDAAVNVLADKMVGVHMGNRKNPFAGFSKHAPFNLTELPYADEVKEVLALVAKLKKAKPAADVAKAAAACEKLANAVTAALAKLSKPQLAYSKSLATRDALLPAWTKSLNRLKRTAAAAWFDEPGTYRAVFAAPERVQAPVHKRAKKVTAPVAASTPSTTNGTSGAAVPATKATTTA